MPKRPLIDSTIRTEFGDVMESPEFYDVGAADRDLSYVPGFSDMRRKRDKALADVAQGKVKKWEVDIDPLPVNCLWVRAYSVLNQQPDTQKQVGASNEGYRLVHKDEVGHQEWLTELPPGASISPDGSIRKGDTVLMVTDGKTALRNAARKQAATRAQSMAAQNTADGLLQVRSQFKGTDPYIKQETASAEK